MLMLMTLFMASCSNDDNNDTTEDVNLRTLFVYMPWSGDRLALTEDFYTNISDLEESITENGLNHERVIVFFSSSSTKAAMYEITLNNGICRHDTLKTYTNPEFTTTEGLSSIISDMKAFAPATNYSMVIGCHGMGWIPVGASTRSAGAKPMKMHWENTSGPMTRFFGGTDEEYQTDISTLAEAITNNGIKMEYILFDDCYMASIEVAYELKDVSNYLIGSTSEIMGYGMSYDIIGGYLLGTPNYEAVCNGFYTFYSAYSYPYGTISVTDCSQLDEMAAIMKTINGLYTFDSSLTDNIQRLDGYTPTIFFDYGDYVANLCTDSTLLKEFNEQLERTVPYKTHTEYYYSMFIGTVKINTFSGITTSDPSTEYTTAKQETSWYAATH